MLLDAMSFLYRGALGAFANILLLLRCFERRRGCSRTASQSYSHPVNLVAAALSSRAYVVTPSSGAAEYARAVHQYASDNRDEEWARANLAPDAVVYCASEADVVATVRVATSTSPPVHLSARSGGHSYSGHSSRTKGQGGWVVDVSKLEAVQQVDATVMRVGPGVKLHRLNAELLKRRLSFPKGICRGVAVGGHLQSSAAGLLFYLQVLVNWYSSSSTSTLGLRTGQALLMVF